jgi:hypothetical protein
MDDVPYLDYSAAGKAIDGAGDDVETDVKSRITSTSM